MADRDQSIEFLISVAKSSAYTPAVRIGAIEGLGHAGGGVARDYLADVVKSSTYTPRMRETAAIALGRACRA